MSIGTKMADAPSAVKPLYTQIHILGLSKYICSCD